MSRIHPGAASSAPTLCVLAAASLLTVALPPRAAHADDVRLARTSAPTATARVTLRPAEDALFEGVTTPGTPAGEVPNYLRALAVLPNTVKSFAELYTTFLYGGTLAPELKMAMGLKVAEQARTPYVAAHLKRLLGATDEGRRLLGKAKSPSEAKAVEYAALLTADVNGVSGDKFAALRGSYNDAQIVELTMTTCFFNYFTRLCAAANLPIEPWIDAPVPPLPARKTSELATARVALASDAELDAAVKLRPGPGGPSTPGLGAYVANSRRAMVRVPDMAEAWFGYWSMVRQYDLVTRPEKLQVSFAVSMVNGCRYCTLHQVQGLRKSGVDVAKLVAMKKDDSALTPREKTAVTFARTLTRLPNGVTDADWQALTNEFTEPGAMEVLLQTCAFSFMNRFTDPLNLPSEDEAVAVYQEVYGEGAYGQYFDEQRQRKAASR